MREGGAPPSARPSAPLGALPAEIWVLGFAALLMDASSELVHSLLPVLMVSVLGASMGALGMVEGIAEATASIAKVFSGVMSDPLRRGRVLVVPGKWSVGTPEKTFA